MRRVLAGCLFLAGALLAASSAFAADAQGPNTRSMDAGHPSETMQQSEAAGQVNGVPTLPAQFLTTQGPGDLMASEMLGKPVINAGNETVGEINDLIADESGRLIGVTIGVGGFLGIGQKDVAVQFKDIRVTRDAGGRAKILANLTKASLTAAPAYRTLGDQAAGRVPSGQVKHDF